MDEISATVTMYTKLTWPVGIILCSAVLIDIIERNNAVAKLTVIIRGNVSDSYTTLVVNSTFSTIGFYLVVSFY